MSVIGLLSIPSANAGTRTCGDTLRELVVSASLVQALDLVPADKEFASKVLGNFWRHVWEKDTRRAIAKLNASKRDYKYWSNSDPSFLENRDIKSLVDFANYNLQELSALLLMKKDITDKELRLAARTLRPVRSFLQNNHLGLQYAGVNESDIAIKQKHNQESIEALDKLIAQLSEEHRMKVEVFEADSPILSSEEEFTNLITEISESIETPNIAKPMLTGPICVEHWCFGGQEISVYNCQELQDAINLGAIEGRDGSPAPIKTFAIGSALSMGPSFSETDFLFWHIRGFEAVQSRRDEQLQRDPALRVHLLQNKMFTTPQQGPCLLQYRGISQQTLELILLEAIRRGQIKLPK